MWRALFPKGRISFMEFDKACAEKYRTAVEKEAGGKLYPGDQADPALLKKVLSLAPPACSARWALRMLCASEEALGTLGPFIPSTWVPGKGEETLSRVPKRTPEPFSLIFPVQHFLFIKL